MQLYRAKAAGRNQVCLEPSTVSVVSAEEKALLFAGVEMREAAEITQRLEAADIPYEMRGDGGSIYVARSQVLDARMMLSAEGLPSRGSIGYEIFAAEDDETRTRFIAERPSFRHPWA